MSVDKNNPAGTSDDQADGQIESLESTEIEGVDLESISGGMTMSPVAPTATRTCPNGYTM